MYNLWPCVSIVNDLLQGNLSYETERREISTFWPIKGNIWRRGKVVKPKIELGLPFIVSDLVHNFIWFTKGNCSYWAGIKCRTHVWMYKQKQEKLTARCHVEFWTIEKLTLLSNFSHSIVNPIMVNWIPSFLSKEGIHNTIWGGFNIPWTWEGAGSIFHSCFTRLAIIRRGESPYHW